MLVRKGRGELGGEGEDWRIGECGGGGRCVCVCVCVVGGEWVSAGEGRGECGGRG